MCRIGNVLYDKNEWNLVNSSCVPHHASYTISFFENIRMHANHFVVVTLHLKCVTMHCSQKNHPHISFLFFVFFFHFHCARQWWTKMICVVLHICESWCCTLCLCFLVFFYESVFFLQIHEENGTANPHNALQHSYSHSHTPRITNFIFHFLLLLGARITTTMDWLRLDGGGEKMEWFPKISFYDHIFDGHMFLIGRLQSYIIYSHE